jgi:hypothetical protein
VKLFRSAKAFGVAELCECELKALTVSALEHGIGIKAVEAKYASFGVNWQHPTGISIHRARSL